MVTVYVFYVYIITGLMCLVWGVLHTTTLTGKVTTFTCGRVLYMYSALGGIIVGRVTLRLIFMVTMCFVNSRPSFYVER